MTRSVTSSASFSGTTEIGINHEHETWKCNETFLDCEVRWIYKHDGKQQGETKHAKAWAHRQFIMSVIMELLIPGLSIERIGTMFGINPLNLSD